MWAPSPESAKVLGSPSRRQQLKLCSTSSPSSSGTGMRDSAHLCTCTHACTHTCTCMCMCTCLHVAARIMGLEVAGDICLRDSSHDISIQVRTAQALKSRFQYFALSHYKNSYKTCGRKLLLGLLELPPGVSHIPVQGKASCSSMTVGRQALLGLSILQPLQSWGIGEALYSPRGTPPAHDPSRRQVACWMDPYPGAH